MLEVEVSCVRFLFLEGTDKGASGSGFPAPHRLLSVKGINRHEGDVVALEGPRRTAGTSPKCNFFRGQQQPLRPVHINVGDPTSTCISYSTRIHSRNANTYSTNSPSRKTSRRTMILSIKLIPAQSGVSGRREAMVSCLARS